MLKGKLGWKGERGYSAYEIAVQNGYEGSEQDWLATLGTSSHFTQNKETYTTTTANEDTFDLPTTYTSNCFVDVYVEGERLNSNEYTVNTQTNEVVLTNPLEVVGTKVEIIMITMSTNNLPIVTTINSSSTNSNVPGTKATYDFVKGEVSNYKLNGDFAILTGTLAGQESSSVKFNYPEGFTKDNCVVLSLTRGDGTYNYCFPINEEGETLYYPSIKMSSDKITVYDAYAYLVAPSTITFTYKVVLMKVGETNE